MNDRAQKKLEEITQTLVTETPDLKNAGLLNGKTGISLYFFHLSKKTQNTEHHEFAGKLLDEVYEKVSDNQLPPDFANGLAGIAWGIEHLAQHEFVEADTDQILSDVDDKIYQYITNNKDLPTGVRQGIMGHMIYILSRLGGKDLETNNTNTRIFKRLLIELINRLGTAIEEKKMIIQEPRLFNITWELPVSLVLLSRCYAMHVHTHKIERILEYLSPALLSLYPRLSCHRLFLLFGLESVRMHFELPRWKSHAGLLKQNIHSADILEHELKNKSIHFKNGAAGMAFISRQYVQYTGDSSFQMDSKNLLRKIIESEQWTWMEQHPSEKEDLGLFTGITGIGMELLKLLKEEQAEANLV